MFVGWLVRSFVNIRPTAALAGRRPVGRWWSGDRQASGVGGIDIAVAFQVPGGELRPTNTFSSSVWFWMPLKIAPYQWRELKRTPSLKTGEALPPGPAVALPLSSVFWSYTRIFICDIS